MQSIKAPAIWEHNEAFSRRMKTSYNTETALAYRQNDQRDIQTPASKEVISTLENLCGEFPQRINAIDIGCGSGRFFHALKQVNELVGLDISEDMLDVATQPIKKELFDISKIRLIKGDILTADLPKNSFDLAYSIGVFGHPAPFSLKLINRLYDILAPGGKLFFTIADMLDPKYRATLEKSTARKLIERSLPYLPDSIAQPFRSRWQSYYLSKEELDATAIRYR
ncbi:MAG: SAM-dependent methyltransferase [Porticoccus sp.]|jgi:SAM-dependent methyltransferase